MTERELFARVGIRPEPPAQPKKKRFRRDVPWFSFGILGGLLLCCLCAELLMTKDPTYLDLTNCNVAPNSEFLFGTDSLGRDIFPGSGTAAGSQ